MQFIVESVVVQIIVLDNVGIARKPSRDNRDVIYY